MAKVLIVDDEKLIVKGLKFSLEQDGYEVDCAYDGGEAIEMVKANHYDVMLLDIMLPVFDGYEVCSQVREFSDLPIIMLSAKSTDMDKIMGLDYGADDYITKPFNVLEAKARIKAILRRTAPKKTAAAKEEDSNVLSVEGLRMNRQSRRTFVEGREVKLTTKEFDILELLVTNPGKVFSRDQLLQIIWAGKQAGDARTVDVHVRRLREKIESDPSDPKYVYTKWGLGYFYKG